MSATLRGSLFMVLAMAAFAVEDVLFKSATTQFPVGAALTLFGAGGAVIFAGLSRRAGEAIWNPAFLTRPLLIRSAFELMGRLFYALALALTPLSSTSAILQATPLVVTLGAVLVLGEHVGPRHWIAMAVGFLGVLLILRPTPDSFEPTSLFAVLGMIGFAGRDLATRASPPTVSAYQLGTLGFLVLVAAGVVIHLAAPQPIPMPPGGVVSMLAAASVIGVVAYGALTLAMRNGDIGVVAPFRYSRLIFALILAVAVFGERPDTLTLAGAALIVASGLYTLVRSRRRG